MHHPKRIVLLAAELPAIVHELGALDRVVGISAYTTEPVQALSLPKVGGFSHADPERVLAQRPDLVILTSGVQRQLGDQLAAHGVSLLHLNPHRLTDLGRTIALLGALLQARSAADALIARLWHGLAQLRRQGRALPWRPRVYFEEWPDPLIFGTGWVSDLITIAGGVDIFRSRAGVARSALARSVQAADVLALRPDLMLASWCGRPFDSKLVARRGQAWRPLAEGCTPLEGTILQCGPMLLEAAQRLHSVLSAHVAQHPNPPDPVRHQGPDLL